MNYSPKTKKKNKFDGYFTYGTHYFNEITKRNAHVDSMSKKIKKYFIDPKTNLLYLHMSEAMICAVCGGKVHRTVFVKDGFTHVKCCACGFIFVNPTAKDKYRDHFFGKLYRTWTKVLLTPEQESMDAGKFKYGLEFIEKHMPGKGLLVDIGAGSGLFLETAKNNGWDVSGIEFNSEAVKVIQKRKIKVFAKSLEDNIYAVNSVDVVTIWEVLEHINHPVAFIKQVRNILKPGGLLFICVPNINALVTRILQEKSRTFGGSSHVNFFSIDTLSRLAKKNNFKVLETDNVISELGTIKNYLSYEDPYSGSAELCLDFLTPEYLYKNNLGSRIFMLCRKIR